MRGPARRPFRWFVGLSFSTLRVRAAGRRLTRNSTALPRNNADLRDELQCFSKHPAVFTGVAAGQRQGKWYRTGICHHVGRQSNAHPNTRTALGCGQIN